jgi:hypothetical protein
LTSTTPASCGCSFGLKLSCNNCAGWNFESGTLETWRMEPGMVGTLNNVSWGGSRALALRLENTGTRISVPLCPPSGMSTDFKDRTISVRVAFVSDSGYAIPTMPPLSVAFTGETSIPPLPGWGYWTGEALSEGAYKTHTATVTTMGGNVTTDLSRVIFIFDAGAGWSGTIYFDSVSFN